jgi:hypothetical protein
MKLQRDIAITLTVPDTCDVSSALLHLKFCRPDIQDHLSDDGLNSVIESWVLTWPEDDLLHLAFAMTQEPDRLYVHTQRFFASKKR